MELIKTLRKIVGEISYHAGVATDYSHEIHKDPDKGERIGELDQIIKKLMILKCIIFLRLKIM